MVAWLPMCLKCRTKCLKSTRNASNGLKMIQIGCRCLKWPQNDSNCLKMPQMRQNTPWTPQMAWIHRKSQSRISDQHGEQVKDLSSITARHHTATIFTMQRWYIIFLQFSDIYNNPRKMSKSKLLEMLTWHPAILKCFVILLQKRHKRDRSKGHISHFVINRRTALKMTSHEIRYLWYSQNSARFDKPQLFETNRIDGILPVATRPAHAFEI